MIESIRRRLAEDLVGSGEFAVLSLELEVGALMEPLGNSDAKAPIALSEVERLHIDRTLRETEWVIDGPSGAARSLGPQPARFPASDIF